jgi:hypothetical protein
MKKFAYGVLTAVVAIGGVFALFIFALFELDEEDARYRDEHDYEYGMRGR